MRKALAAGLALILAAGPAAVARGGERLKGEVIVEVVAENGERLPAIPHQDRRRTGTRIVKQYLEAMRGRNYGIVVRNGTNERIGVVIAVDGRNIISGGRSELSHTEEMYLVDAFGEGRYDGWRTDQDTVHRFYFTDPGDSYSMRTFRDSSAMGVIGVAVFREHRARRGEPRSKGPSPAPLLEESSLSRSGAAAAQDAGTGFGEEQYSPTIRVDFIAERSPVQKVLIKYEWRERLCAMGIVDCREGTGNRLWDDAHYAPFPPAKR